jgi:uncharacterized protein (TIGR00290 family)
MTRKAQVLLSWSSGKDSAWALHVLRRRPEVEVVGLFSTVNETFRRVSMHAVRIELLELQARSVGLPLDLVEIPYPCSNEAYAACMTAFVRRSRERCIDHFAFGDLFLEDVRRYREERLADTGITPVFPLWGAPTHALSRQMLEEGLRARITCVDPGALPAETAGRAYDASFLDELPEAVDPCGEKGEFHTFVVDGPMFRRPVPVRTGEIVHRDGLVFADLLGASTNPKRSR